MSDVINNTDYYNEEFFDLLESEKFKDNAPETILKFLGNRVKLIPFGDYLKRLIYKKAGFTGGISSIEFEKYQQYLIERFKETNTPLSFKESSAKLSGVTKNWLKAVTVSRETVFLIGFALELSSDEVSDLLTKGIHEGKIFYRNSLEAICGYCLDHHLPYQKMLELTQQYDHCSKKINDDAKEMQTIGISSLIKKCVDDEMLLDVIKEFGLDPFNNFSFTARQEFDKLYSECVQIAEKQKCLDDEWDISAKVFKNKSALLSIKKKMKPTKITSSDIEKLLNAGTPIDSNGNLLRFSDSALCESFRSKRMTRQHINDILKGKIPVDRFDLLTMKFFIHAYLNKDKTNNECWFSFVEECNMMLTKCSMGQIYNANPYDVFLQMCMLTDVPLATYDDILEMSYEK